MITSDHILYVTTSKIPRTPITGMSSRIHISRGNRDGWGAWLLQEGDSPEEYLGGEFEKDLWLVLDVDGRIICNSRDKAPTEAIGASRRNIMAVRYVLTIGLFLGLFVCVIGLLTGDWDSQYGILIMYLSAMFIGFRAGWTGKEVDDNRKNQ
jgi:hypothetical protein